MTAGTGTGKAVAEAKEDVVIGVSASSGATGGGGIVGSSAPGGGGGNDSDPDDNNPGGTGGGACSNGHFPRSRVRTPLQMANGEEGDLSPELLKDCMNELEGIELGRIRTTGISKSCFK